MWGQNSDRGSVFLPQRFFIGLGHSCAHTGSDRECRVSAERRAWPLARLGSRRVLARVSSPASGSAQPSIGLGRAHRDA